MCSFTQMLLEQPSTLSPAGIAIDRTFVRFGSFIVVLKVYEALLLTAVNAIDALSIRKHLASTCGHRFMQCSSAVAIVTGTLFTSMLSCSTWQTQFTNPAPNPRSRSSDSSLEYASSANESLETRRGWSSTGCLSFTNLSATSNALRIDGARSNLLLLPRGFIILKAELVPRK